MSDSASECSVGVEGEGQTVLVEQLKNRLDSLKQAAERRSTETNRSNFGSRVGETRRSTTDDQSSSEQPRRNLHYLPALFGSRRHNVRFLVDTGASCNVLTRLQCEQGAFILQSLL